MAGAGSKFQLEMQIPGIFPTQRCAKDLDDEFYTMQFYETTKQSRSSLIHPPYKTILQEY